MEEQTEGMEQGLAGSHCTIPRRNLSLVKELGDRAAQGRAYGNLGNTHYLLGSFTEATAFHKEVSVGYPRGRLEDRLTDGLLRTPEGLTDWPCPALPAPGDCKGVWRQGCGAPRLQQPGQCTCLPGALRRGC